MKKSDAVGRRIVKVFQERVFDENLGRWRWAVTAFELDNGSTLTFTTIELPGEYGTDVSVVKR